MNTDLDYIESELKQTTVGYKNGRWTTPPVGTHWKNALDKLATLYTVEPTPIPTPTPTPTTGFGSFYETATAYSKSRPAFIAGKTFVIKSQSDLHAAYNQIVNMTSADHWLFDCQDGFEVDEEFTWNIDVKGLIRVDWKIGAEAVKFRNSSLAVFYGPNVNNVQFFGGDVSSKGAACPGIFIAKANNVIWWDFVSHDNGSDGLSIFSGFGDFINVDFKGELYNNGTSIAGDPHGEKGTGVHACNSADDPNSFIGYRIALDVHDQPTGAALQHGNPAAPLSNGQIYLKVKHLGIALPGTTWDGYAKSQVAGNALQLWGGGKFSNVIVKCIEADTLMGRAVETDGIYSGNDGGITVEYARATNCCLSAGLADSSLGRKSDSHDPYSKNHGIIYKNVA